MKKILVSLVVALSTLVVNAQVDKGVWMLSANSNLGFSSYSSKLASSNPTVFVVNSKAGYFVANNFALGVNLGYMSIGSGGSGSATNASTIGIFTRGFLGKGFFLGGGFNSSSLSSGGSSYSTFPFELGFAGFISNNFAIEPSINYVLAGDSDKGGVPVLGIPTSANSSIGLNLAFTFYLNRSEKKD